MRTPVSYDDLHSLAEQRLGDRPFTSAEATAGAIGPALLSRLARAGVLRRMVKGVHVLATTPDSLQLRCSALRLVVPPDAVVTDRTAGWLHGVEMVLAPNDHLIVPPVSAFHRIRGCRLRNDLTASGQRMMPESDVEEIFGLLVTTRLRTAVDLTRLLPRQPAFAALEQMFRGGGFSHRDLFSEVPRFKGYRGVVQLRELVPLADPRSQSPGESIVRLRWIDCTDLPRPEPQVEVPGLAGSTYAVDMGVEGLRIGAEYDGEQWHGPDREEHDRDRRDWMKERCDWAIEVFKKEHLRTPGAVERALRKMFYDKTGRLGGS